VFVEVEVSALVLRIWNIFAQMLAFVVVGFSKRRSLYLNVREAYAFNLQKIVKKCVIYTP